MSKCKVSKAPLIILICTWAVLTLESSTRVNKRGPISPARSPIIIITTSISMSVNPLSLAGRHESSKDPFMHLQRLIEGLLSAALHIEMRFGIGFKHEIDLLKAFTLFLFMVNLTVLVWAII